MISTILKAILELIAAMSAPRATRDKLSRPANPSNSTPLRKAISGFKFSVRSLKALDGVDPDLIRVARRALELTTVDFVVTEGLRTVERQKELVALKASKTMRSKHLVGRAIDVMAVVPEDEDPWDFKWYFPIAGAFKQASKELGIPIVWGGDWKSFKDGVHFELADGGEV